MLRIGSEPRRGGESCTPGWVRTTTRHSQGRNRCSAVAAAGVNSQGRLGSSNSTSGQLLGSNAREPGVGSVRITWPTCSPVTWPGPMRRTPIGIGAASLTVSDAVAVAMPGWSAPSVSGWASAAVPRAAPTARGRDRRWSRCRSSAGLRRRGRRSADRGRRCVFTSSALRRAGPDPDGRHDTVASPPARTSTAPMPSRPATWWASDHVIVVVGGGGVVVGWSDRRRPRRRSRPGASSGRPARWPSGTGSSRTRPRHAPPRRVRRAP